MPCAIAPARCRVRGESPRANRAMCILRISADNRSAYRNIMTITGVTVAGMPRRVSATGNALAGVVAANVSEAATPSVPLMTIPHAA